MEEADLATLGQTRTRAKTQARLVGDIGGTHARFAIADANGRLDHVRVLRCAQFTDPEQAIRHYLALTGLALPSAAAFGVANPVSGDEVVMTNHHWRFSAAALRAAIGLQRLLLLNDFTALALALPLLQVHERHAVGGGQIVTGAAIGVLGPGTGLGVSGLVAAAGHYVPLQGEGGHVTLAARNRREADVIDCLRQHDEHVSAERVLSGPGLIILHDALRAMAGQPAASLPSTEISARAIASTCPYCMEALHLFCALLGTVAADLALTLGARGGVYLGGGIAPKILPLLEEGGFVRAFRQRGAHAALMPDFPVRVIRNERLGLLGALAIAAMRDEKA